MPQKKKKGISPFWIISPIVTVVIAGALYVAWQNQQGGAGGASPLLQALTQSLGGGGSGMSANITASNADGALSGATGGKWKTDAQPKVSAWQFGGNGSEEIVDAAQRGDERMIVLGVSSSKDLAPAGVTVHQLGSGTGEKYAFVAELSSDGQTMNWISVFGGDLIDPKCVALGPDGSIAIGGGLLDNSTNFNKFLNPDTAAKGRKSAIASVSADGKTLNWMIAGGPNQDAVSDVAVDKQGRVLWVTGTIARGASSYVMRVNADGSASTFPDQDEGREWAIDFDVRGGQFLNEGQVGAYYAKGKSGDGYDYDGPGKWGPTRFKLLGIRQRGHLELMPNGDIVVCGTLQYDFRVKGTKQFPAFDCIVARFTPDGRLIWSSNMYQEGDGVHTPDQKDNDLIYNPHNGELYVLVGQHGSNVYRFKGHLAGDTGNLFIYWIGKVDAETGKIQDGWYWQHSYNTGYSDNGVPVSPPYPRLAGNRGEQLAVDKQGRIYMVGNSGAKAWTSDNAWKPWLRGQTGGGDGMLAVISPDLKNYEYASMIRGDTHGATKMKAVIVGSKGIFCFGSNASRNYNGGNQPAWANSSTKGEKDAAVAFFQFP